MINLQALMDGMSAQWQKERAEHQLTLGNLIDELQAMPQDAMVVNLCEPHSYRGYYSDLAFELGEGKRSAKELLDICKTAMGEVFIGYKGGDFVMGRNTPLWVSSYGNSSGLRLMSINPYAVEAEND